MSNKAEIPTFRGFPSADWLWHVVACTMLLSVLTLWSSATPSLAGDKYGAIAYSQVTRCWGSAYNYDTRDEAEQRALRGCASKGRGCRVVTWFKNNCGALADGTNAAYGTAWADSNEAAIQKAIDYCRQYGGRNCTWRCWACNSTPAPDTQYPSSTSTDNPFAGTPSSRPSDNPFAGTPSSRPSDNPFAGTPSSRPSDNPFASSLPDCNSILNWAQGLVAAKQTVNKNALGSPQRTEIHPANLHLCYDCILEDGSQGHVLLGGHGGWDAFWPAETRLRRNCDCSKSDMKIWYR